MEKNLSLPDIKKELNERIGDNALLTELVSTTFKGLTVEVAKKAMLEAMIRGFKFDDFLTKNVYAIPFKGSYSLVTSIDYSRKIGMKNGIVGEDMPQFTFNENGVIETCAMTVKKRFIDGYVGEFTALVFFNEYTTKTNLWVSKPMTMITKVAEMHALRKACPEDLSNAYVEEEMVRESIIDVIEPPAEEIISDWRTQLEASADKESFQNVWVNVPVSIKPALKELATTLNKKYEDIKI